jgi:hypothetical protein
MENGGRKMTKSQETGPSLPEAMRFLAHEKSAAKQYAVILSTIAKNEAAQYVRGIEFYAAAKSEFDGLIAQLRIELQTGQEPAKPSPPLCRARSTNCQELGQGWKT